MNSHPGPIFVCPTCGVRENEDIAFICNTCETKDAKHLDGIYYCPQCETHKHPFQCRICDSLEVAYMSPLSTELFNQTSN